MLLKGPLHSKTTGLSHMPTREEVTELLREVESRISEGKVKKAIEKLRQANKKA
jgi:hypothetical protein